MKFLQDLLDFFYLLSLNWRTDVPPQQLPMNAPDTPPVVPPTHQSMLESFCLAIRDYEGAPGSLNYRLNNPGDCRPSPVGYLPKYGNVEIIDTNTDPRYLYHKGKFAKFPTYALGWEYLMAMVKAKAQKNPTQTIAQFMAAYAPAKDSNDPGKYAAFIASRLAVDVNYPMAKIIM